MGPLYFHRYDPALGCVVGIRNCEWHDTTSRHSQIMQTSVPTRGMNPHLKHLSQVYRVRQSNYLADKNSMGSKNRSIEEHLAKWKTFAHFLNNFYITEQ